MKKIVLTLGLIALFSCSKDKATEKTEENVQTVVVEREFQLPSRTEEGKLEKLKVVLTGKIDNEKDELLSREVSENLLEYFGVSTQEEFDKLVNQKFFEQQFPSLLSANADKNLTYANVYENSLNDCIEHFTDDNGKKLKGRGWCKFNCWVESLTRVNR